MSHTYFPEQEPTSGNQEPTLLMLDETQLRKGSMDLVQTIRNAIQTMKPVPMVELAESLYGKPTLDDRGEIRKLQRSEVIVLVPDHFTLWLAEIGMGASRINGRIHIFVGTHWHPIKDADCQILLGQIAARIGHDASDSKSITFCEKLFKQLHFSLLTIAAKSESNRVLINFKNGTLDVIEGNENLREFRKSDNLNYQLPFDYDEQAKCPTFETFLLKVLPDVQSRVVLAEFMGWLFLKDLPLEKALFLYGNGHNGKSVFFKVITSLLGEQNVSTLDLAELSKTESRFHLANVLLNFGSEINARCDVNLFKKLTSGEPVEARRLYKDIYTMRDYGRLAFNANVLPKNTEHTEGFFRRFLIVPFSVTISAEEKDPDLATRIIASEMPGVFNWVMGGLRRLRETRKFSECEAAENALSCYRKESDSVALFLDERGLQASPDGKIGKNELYQEYRHYCTLSGFKSLEKGDFGKRLKNHQIDDSKSGSSRFWRLIRTEHGENFSS